jgi:hypothetical protein
MKKIMKNIFRSGAPTLAAAVILSACAWSDQPTLGPKLSPVKFQTRAAIGAEIGGVELTSVRMIVTDRSGYVMFNEYIKEESGRLGFEEQEELGDDTAGSFIVDVLPGSYDFHTVVNEPASLTATLDAINTDAELALVELPAMTEPEMVFVGMLSGVMVRTSDDGDDTTPDTIGEVSTDGGDNWGDILDMTVARAAVKLTIKAHKVAGTTGDFSVTAASLSNVPEVSYLISRTYGGELESVTLPVNGEGSVALPADNSAVEVVSGYIVPEYLMARPGSEGAATGLTLTAAHDSREIVYEMALLGDGLYGGRTTPNFSLSRGKHYIVDVALSDTNSPTIVYRVNKWDSVSGNVDIGNGDEEEVIGYEAKWADDTRIDAEGVVLVAMNSSTFFEFTLSNPMAEWTAHLSNTDDFEFVGASSGLTSEGFVNRIEIRPLAGTSDNNVTTQLFITVTDASTKTVEIDLNGDGDGNRYVIRQIPS